MLRTAVLNVVGLSRSTLNESTPRLNEFARRGDQVLIRPSLPAVTCTAQSNYLTGKTATDHGIVANGWYDRDLAEVQFWKQSNHLVQSPKLWDELRRMDPKFTVAKLFWWYNMYASVDYSITPRPMYPADGRKVFDVYTFPDTIRPDIKKQLGDFPFPAFWGPGAGTKSHLGPPEAVSEWIAKSARWIEERHEPTLSLIYLPHLDYNLQRFGPDAPEIADDLRRIDTIVGDLIDFFQSRGVQPVCLSEYAITSVRHAIHLNRIFREKGWITIKEELGLELLDCGASKAFAVADHQLAHIYIADPALIPKVRAVLESTPHIREVFNPMERPERGLAHRRSGDLVAIADEDAWFTYYYWLEDVRAPDFARCVDIHRKPGYDPVELFVDPALAFPKLKVAWKLLRKKLGFRMLMDLIPLDATLVKGSHGCLPSDQRHFPLLMLPEKGRTPGGLMDSTDVYSLLKSICVG